MPKKQQGEYVEKKFDSYCVNASFKFPTADGVACP